MTKINVVESLIVDLELEKRQSRVHNPRPIDTLKEKKRKATFE